MLTMGLELGERGKVLPNVKANPKGREPNREGVVEEEVGRLLNINDG